MKERSASREDPATSQGEPLDGGRRGDAEKGKHLNWWRDLLESENNDEGKEGRGRWEKGPNYNPRSKSSAWNSKTMTLKEKNNHLELPIPRKFTNLARSNYRIPSYPPKGKSKSTGLGWKRRGKNRLRSPKLARVTQYGGGLRRAATPRAPAPAVMTAARAQLLWFTAYERGNNTARALPFALRWLAKGSARNIKMGLRYCFCCPWSRRGSDCFLFCNVNFNPQNIHRTKDYR